jgi:hypothetical protein
MKRSMAAGLALGFGLLASIDGAQTASAMPKLPEGAATVSQNSAVTQVWYRGYRGWHGYGYRGWHGWHGDRRGYWRPGYGWVPFAVAGAVIGGAAAYDYYGPRRYYDGPYYDGPDGPPPPPRGYYGTGPGPDRAPPPPPRDYGPDSPPLK